MKRIVASIIFTAALSGCVSTPFKGVPAATLRDDQLITELSSVYQQLGMSTASLSQLRVMMPAPDIRVTANSFTNIYLNTQVFGDTAYTTGMATTRTTYSAYDANQINRSMNEIAQSIQLARINTLNGRRFQLESEAQGRVEARRQQEQEFASAIQHFFAEHPSLRNETDLLQAILPWEQRSSYRETLERIGFEAETVVAGRVSGTLAGRWYGVLQVRSETSSATPDPINVRGACQVSDIGSTCELQSPSGASIVITGIVSETGSFVGRLTSDLVNTDLLGSGSASQLRLSLSPAAFKSSGRISGILTLSR